MRRTHLRWILAISIVVTTALGSAHVSSATTMGNPHSAALQAALAERGYVVGTIDGLVGPLTSAAVASFQADTGLRVTGKANGRTVEALGGPARSVRARSVARRGDTGWNVVRLQFLLAWRGFPSGEFDGVFGERAERATMNFQARAGLTADGVAGPATFRALRKQPQRLRVRLSMPVAAAVGDVFGPRGARFHAGLDLPVAAGTPVTAAKAGKVAYAAFHEGGFGNLVVIQHRNGLRTRYGHLSEIIVEAGESVRRGQSIGLVGSTGRSTGPHLHVEVLLRGALVDPYPLLVN
jgi:murein DD-endopeptidase MepM/ murein hydrolase activator NlpD